MSENTKKKKYAFNVFDVFIILLVIILIASAVYRISQTSAEKANQDNPVYTVYFECDGEYESLAKYLSDGEEVYTSLSLPPLGSLLASLQLGLFLLLFLSILLIFLLFYSPALFIPAPTHPTCPVPTALSFPSPGLGRSALPTADPVPYWSSCL